MLSHLTVDTAFDAVGILAVKRAFLDVLPVSLVRLDNQRETSIVQAAFKRHDIFTLSDLIGYTETQILRFKGIGDSRLGRIKAQLAIYDIELGSDLFNAAIPPDQQDWYGKIYFETCKRLKGMAEQGPLTLELLLR